MRTVSCKNIELLLRDGWNLKQTSIRRRGGGRGGEARARWCHCTNTKVTHVGHEQGPVRRHSQRCGGLQLSITSVATITFRKRERE